MGTSVRAALDRLPQNVGETERLASGLAGALLALAGLRRGGLDGALLTVAGGALVARGATGYCPVYQAIEERNGGEGGATRGVARVEGAPVQQHGASAVLDASESQRIVDAVTVHGTPAELYAFWRDFTNLPKVMDYLESVEILDEKRSRWRVKSVGGATVEWVAEIVRDEPNAFISWKTAWDAPVRHAGSVHFRPSTVAGTEVRVEIEYDPPGGALARAVASVTGRDPAKQVAEELRRFKHLAESGQLAGR